MNKRMAVLLAGAMLMMGMATAANALSLKLSETGHTAQQINDNGTGDFFPTVGTVGVVYPYTYGDFGITVLAGSSSHLNNSIGFSGLTIINNNSRSTETITLTLTDTGFALQSPLNITPNANVNFSIGGQAPNIKAIFTNYINTSNIAFDETNPAYKSTTTIQPFGTSSINPLSGLVNLNHLFSITEELTFVLGHGQSMSFSANTDVSNVVPEPGTMVLLGIGMLGLAIYGKRRMNKEA